MTINEPPFSRIFSSIHWYIFRFIISNSVGFHSSGSVSSPEWYPRYSRSDGFNITSSYVCSLIWPHSSRPCPSSRILNSRVSKCRILSFSDKGILKMVHISIFSAVNRIGYSNPISSAISVSWYFNCNSLDNRLNCWASIQSSMPISDPIVGFPIRLSSIQIFISSSLNRFSVTRTSHSLKCSLSCVSFGCNHSNLHD